MNPIFITGIGTAIGKTVVAAIVTEALKADYWKPVQAGFSEGTDSLMVKNLISNSVTKIHDEIYKLKLAASPHIAAREEGIVINIETIYNKFLTLSTVNHQLIIEGAGGLLVPLNDNEFVIDLIKKLNAKVILVSRNYLGSINHSLLTAEVCRAKNIDVIGWIFNDQYLHYEDEIVRWSNFKKIASIPKTNKVNKKFIQQQALLIKEKLVFLL
ncbi:MAG: dethiobiotin synthase [Chitinophagaceae bacterium]